MDSQVQYVKQRFRSHFQRLVEILQAFPPPGDNAANGWVRTTIVHDAAILQQGLPPTVALTSADAQRLLSSYYFWYQCVQRAYNENGNHCAGVNAVTAWTGVQAILNNIWQKMRSALGSLISGQEALAIKQTIELILKSIDTHTVYSGCHANGHISEYIRDAAAWTLSDPRSALDAHFPPGTASDAGRVAAALHAVFTQIQTLPTDNHNPWLRAEWQVEFQAMLMSGIVLLDSTT